MRGARILLRKRDQGKAGIEWAMRGTHRNGRNPDWG
jgi:hypothetical protein